MRKSALFSSGLVKVCSGIALALMCTACPRIGYAPFQDTTSNTNTQQQLGDTGNGTSTGSGTSNGTGNATGTATGNGTGGGSGYTLLLIATQNQSAGVCQGNFTVTLLHDGVPVAAGSNGYPLSLTGGQGLVLSSVQANNCGGSPSVTVPANLYSASFYAEAVSPGTYSITVSDPSGLYAPMTVPVTFAPPPIQVTPTGIVLSRPNVPTTGAAIPVGAGDCVLLTVQLTAQEGGVTVPVTLKATDPALEVDLSQTPTNATSFFFDSTNCDQSTQLDPTRPKVFIKSGTGSYTFSYTNQISIPNGYTLYADAGSLHGQLQLAIAAGAPDQVAITSATSPDTIAAGTCTAFRAGYRDVFGNLTSFADQTTQITITGIPGMIYTDGPSGASGGCTKLSSDGTFSLSPGQSEVNFWVDSTTANPKGYNVVPTAGGLQSIDFLLKVSAATGLVFVINTSPVPGQNQAIAGTCIDFTLEMVDMYGNPADPPVAASATISEAKGRGTLYKGFGCSTALNGGYLTVDPNSQNVDATTGVHEDQFSFMDMTAYPNGDGIILHATPIDSVHYGGSQYPIPPPFQLVPGPANHFFVSNAPAPFTVSADCSGAVPVSFVFEDQYNNVSPITQATNVSVVLTSYRDINGAANGSPVVPIIYTANQSGGCGTKAQTDPTNPQGSLIPLAAGASGGTFWVSYAVAETFSLNLTAPYVLPPITPEPLSLTTKPGSPASLVFVGLPSGTLQVKTGICSIPIEVELLDAFHNPTPNVTGAPLPLTLGPAGSAAFFDSTDADCELGPDQISNSNPLVIGSGNSVATFYFEDKLIENFTLTVSSPSVKGSASEPVSVIGAGPVATAWATEDLTQTPAKEAFVPLTQAVKQTAGICTSAALPFNLELIQALSGPNGPEQAGPVGQDTPIALSATFTLTGAPATSVKFYTTFSDCQAASQALPATNGVPMGNAVTSVTVPAGLVQSPNIWILGTTAATYTVVATASNLVQSVFNLYVGPAAPDHIVFANPPLLTAGSCSAQAFTVHVVDAFGNDSPPVPTCDPNTTCPSTQVTLATVDDGTYPMPDAHYYTDNHCGAMTPVQQISPESAVTSFYVMTETAYNSTANPPGVQKLTATLSNGITGSLPVMPGAGSPSNRTMAIVGPATVPVGTCNAYQVKVTDGSGNELTFYGFETLTVTSGSQNALLYTDANCTNSPGGARLAIPIDPNGPSRSGPYTFYMRDYTNDTPLLIALVPYSDTTLTAQLTVTSQKPCTPESNALATDRQTVVDWAHGGAVYYNAGLNFYDYYHGEGAYVLIYETWTCDANGNPHLVGEVAGRYDNGCFAPETEILTAGGIPKRADLVQKGDELWDPVTKEPLKVHEVMVGPERLPLIELTVGGKKLHVSTKHAMWTKAGLKPAREVTLKDSLLLDDGKFHRVKKIARLPIKEGQLVYNFIMEGKSSRPEERLIAGNGVVTGEWTLQTELEKKSAGRALP